ncbi:MAG: hypothetical protein WDA07_12975 [Leucobacter sp.]
MTDEDQPDIVLLFENIALTINNYQAGRLSRDTTAEVLAIASHMVHGHNPTDAEIEARARELGFAVELVTLK